MSIYNQIFENNWELVKKIIMEKYNNVPGYTDMYNGSDLKDTANWIKQNFGNVEFFLSENKTLKNAFDKKVPIYESILTESRYFDDREILIFESDLEDEIDLKSDDKDEMEKDMEHDMKKKKKTGLMDDDLDELEKDDDDGDIDDELGEDKDEDELDLDDKDDITTDEDAVELLNNILDEIDGLKKFLSSGGADLEPDDNLGEEMSDEDDLDIESDEDETSIDDDLDEDMSKYDIVENATNSVGADGTDPLQVKSPVARRSKKKKKVVKRKRDKSCTMNESVLNESIIDSIRAAKHISIQILKKLKQDPYAFDEIVSYDGGDIKAYKRKLIRVIMNELANGNYDAMANKLTRIVDDGMNESVLNESIIDSIRAAKHISIQILKKLKQDPYAFDEIMSYDGGDIKAYKRKLIKVILNELANGNYDAMANKLTRIIDGGMNESVLLEGKNIIRSMVDYVKKLVQSGKTAAEISKLVSNAIKKHADKFNEIVPYKGQNKQLYVLQIQLFLLNKAMKGQNLELYNTLSKLYDTASDTMSESVSRTNEWKAVVKK